MAETEPKISVTDQGESKKRLDIEVPAERVIASLDLAFKTLRQRVRLPGFRPGKAPLPMLEQRYGQQVRGDVIESLVREAYETGLAQHNVAAVAAPEIVVEPLDGTKVLRFSATVDVCPDVSVSDYEGLDLTRPIAPVEDADVENVLARLAEAAATIEPVMVRDAVEANDVVTLDVAGSVEGRPLEDLQRQGVLIEAGEGSFPGALEERLVGLVKGTTSTVDVDYPDEYPNTTLAGKRAAFTVSISAIGKKNVPPLDDDFARGQGDYESLAALRERVRSDLEREAERRADAAVREAAVDALIERHPFDPPEPIVERRCDALIASLDVRLPPGADGQKALATLRQELRPRAIRDGKAAILLDRLAEQRGIEVEEDEVVDRVKRIASRSGAAHGHAEQHYANEERRRALRTQILREKALEVVVDRSKIRTVEKR
jgi:trigger factor